MMTHLTSKDLEAALAASTRVLIATDFDGTLCRIARSPELVFLAAETRDTLQRLAQLENAAVAVVSGRTLEDTREQVQLPLIYAGNHGFEIEGPTFAFEHPIARGDAPLLEEACVKLEQEVAKWEGAWVERKRLTATVHFRNVRADEQHRVQLAVRRTLAPFGCTFGLRAGKRALEVRPRVEWHKGAAVEYIREQIGFSDALCICLGDDVTDETMFRMYPDGLTIRVGWHGGSAARFYVETPAEVCHVLSQIANYLSPADTLGAGAVETSNAALC